MGESEERLPSPRRGRRRPVLPAALAAALAVTAATPAFGLHELVIDWFEAEPAPEPVQLEFARLGVGAPPGMDPGVIQSSARKVTEVRLSDGLHVLWVTPTRNGGFCVQWTNLWGGCRSRTPPPTPARLSPDLNPFLIGAGSEQDNEGVTMKVGGSLLARDAHQLVAEYEDGDTTEIPFVWVSPPIDAGFYLYEVPQRHRRVGHRLTALAALDADGDEIARQTFRLPRPEDVQRPQRLPDGGP